jgi:hypothetical protein
MHSYKGHWNCPPVLMGHKVASGKKGQYGKEKPRDDWKGKDKKFHKKDGSDKFLVCHMVVGLSGYLYKGRILHGEPMYRVP